MNTRIKSDPHRGWGKFGRINESFGYKFFVKMLAAFGLLFGLCCGLQMHLLSSPIWSVMWKSALMALAMVAFFYFFRCSIVYTLFKRIL
jgi:hypothetical protein